MNDDAQEKHKALMKQMRERIKQAYLRIRELEHLVELARADEREAAAKMVDHILKPGGGTWGDAIRARGNT